MACRAVAGISNFEPAAEANGRDDRKERAETSEDNADLPKRLCAQSSTLWHPGQPHSLTDALACGEISRIVGRCAVAEATNGEGWIERKPRFGCGPRLIQRVN
jgi:hypothetical protein